MSRRVLVDVVFEEKRHQTFREYCRNKRIFFLDELTAKNYMEYSYIYSSNSPDVTLLEQHAENYISKNITSEKLRNIFFAELESLDISVRSLNILKKLVSEDISKRRNVNLQRLSKMKNVGTKILAEIMSISEELELIVNSIQSKENDNFIEKLDLCKIELAENKQELETDNSFEHQLSEEILLLKNLYAQIPIERHGKLLHQYIMAYYLFDNLSQIKPIYEIISPVKIIAKITGVFKSIVLDYSKIEPMRTLLEFLSINIIDNMSNITESVLYDSRTKHIVYEKALGKTLESIGNEIGVTRERIRQILSIAEKKIVAKINYLNIDIIMFIALENNCGYLLTIKTIEEYLANAKNKEIIIKILKDQKSISKYFIYNKKIESFVLKQYENKIDFLIKETKNWPKIIAINDANGVVDEISYKYDVPKSLITYLANQRYIITSQLYYCNSTTLGEKYEYILKNYYPSGIRPYDGEQVSKFREQVTTAFGDMILPENDRAIEGRITAIAFLWDRGLYIHKDLVPRPLELLSKIEGRLFKKLSDNNVRFTMVNILWSEFEEDLLKEGVTSETALYSILRNFGSAKFTYPRYPQIYLSSNFKNHRFSLCSLIEEFIIENDGVCSKEELREFAISEIGLKKFQFEQTLAAIGDIVLDSENNYISIASVSCDHKQLDRIISYAVELASKDTHFSVQKIIKNRPVECNLLGIDDAKVMYGLLRYYASDRLSLPRFPNIFKVDKYLNEQINLTMTVCNWLKEKNRPVAYEELRQYFLSERGYSENALNAVLNNDVLLRYACSTYVHKDTLGLSNDIIKNIEDKLNNEYSKQLSLNEPYIRVSDLVEKINFPALINGILWTPTLLRSILRLTRNYCILGAANNIVIPLNNNLGIEKMEDFVGYILKKDFNGACYFKDLEQKFISIGMINKKLTRTFLKVNDQVEIKDDIVSLRRV